MQAAAGFLAVFTVFLFAGLNQAVAADGSKYAHSDSDSRFLHHIDLYDSNNRKITPNSDQPYSSVKTCGRCHDYETISHGWHFNAFASKSLGLDVSRPSEPWIWTDARTGTQLPLSYRLGTSSFHPSEIGISTWEMTQKFGARIPGGGIGAETDPAPADDSSNSAGSDDAVPADDEAQSEPTRWNLTGTLDIDCMICHASPGAYDFNQRRAQIDEENFAWAATAALRLGVVDGKVSRIKTGSDPSDETVSSKLPKVTYDARRFSSEGTVFMDLIREPANNSCFQCHSNRTVSNSGIEARWIHDEDVHIRAGMACADCHRNGIDHHIVRGFPGEANPSGNDVSTLSCAGCHLGTNHSDEEAEVNEAISARAGRLGSPKPMHAGLPPVHFDKLSCTACHGGPIPRDQALRIMTSFAHGLGDKGHRVGDELPATQGPVYTPRKSGSHTKVTPQRAVWPAFWTTLSAGKLTPIHPETVYDTTRRALRVRKNFVDELVRPKMGSSDLKKVLGDDNYKKPREEWTNEERKLVDAAQAEKGKVAFNEKMAAALEALEKE